MKKLFRESFVCLLAALVFCNSVVFADSIENEVVGTDKIDAVVNEESESLEEDESLEENEIDENISQNISSEESKDMPQEMEDNILEELSSGSCGTNVNWSYSNRTLTISGSGNMTNYSGYEKPWTSFSDDIITIIINNGVTSIGDNAFTWMDNLKNVLIPSSVKRIGENAFSWSDGLETIVIPSTVTTMGDYVFSGCYGLKDANIDANISELPAGTFTYCKNLKKVKFSNNITSIGAYAFSDCANLETITIPSQISNLGWGVFDNCSNLVKMQFMGDAPRFESDVFRNCNFTAYYNMNSSYWNYRVGNYGGNVTWIGFDPNLPFKDVNPTAWYYNTVRDIYKDKLMTGMSSDTFAPNSNMTRAQAIVVMYRFVGSPYASYSGNFPDVNYGKWYTQAIAWANQNKVMTGYENGYFGTNDNITREQFATMLYRFTSNYLGREICNSGDIYGRFWDAGSSSDYAYEALCWAVGNGVISGKDNGTRIAARELATRAECAAMIERYLSAFSD